MRWLAILLCCSCAPEPLTGSFSLLTYNVAGLPQGSNDDQFPERNIPQISPKLNAYDVVLVQEDFAYTFELRAELELPFESYPKEIETRFMNDGLNMFSRFAFAPELERVMWSECNGVEDSSNDCLAEKGFSFTTMTVAEGVTIDVVDLHMDAGGSAEDEAARDAQIDQLLAFLPADRPLIVAGDTNLSFDIGANDSDEPRLRRLIDEGGFVDACTAMNCADVNRIDRVFVRGGLTVTSWKIAAEMVDADGLPLSDHEAVAVDITWTAAPAAAQ
jgi:endonuclease/exonuclease/phosphatase family metal-dependent hydrolase